MLMPPAAKRAKQVAHLELDDVYGIKALLSDEYKTDISLIKVHSCQLESKQQLQVIIQELTKKLPHFQHLKRVHDRNVLICPTADIEDTLELHLKQHQISDNVLQALCRNVNVVEVPASSAKLRVQYDQMIKYWPCKFHPDKYAESLQNGSNFTVSQRLFHKRMAQLLRSLSKDLNEDHPVAICVDPRQPSIVAIAGKSNETKNKQGSNTDSNCRQQQRQLTSTLCYVVSGSCGTQSTRWCMEIPTRLCAGRTEHNTNIARPASGIL